MIGVTGRSLPVGLKFNVNKQHWVRVFIVSHSSLPCLKNIWSCFKMMSNLKY